MARVAIPPLLALAVCCLHMTSGRMLTDTAWNLSEVAW